MGTKSVLRVVGIVVGTVLQFAMLGVTVGVLSGAISGGASALALFAELDFLDPVIVPIGHLHDTDSFPVVFALGIVTGGLAGGGVDLPLFLIASFFKAPTEKGAYLLRRMYRIVPVTEAIGSLLGLVAASSCLVVFHLVTLNSLGPVTSQEREWMAKAVVAGLLLGGLLGTIRAINHSIQNQRTLKIEAYAVGDTQVSEGSHG